MHDAAGAHRPGRRLLVVGIAVVVVLYAGLLVLYTVSGQTDGIAVDVPDGGVRVTLRATDFDTQSQRLAMDLDIDPDGGLFEPDTPTLAQPITLIVDPTSGDRQLTYPAGQLPSVTPLQVVVDGDVRTWPFDRYEVEMFVAGLEGSAEDGRALPTAVAIDGRLPGWRLDAVTTNSSPRSSPSASFERITLRRSGDTLVFAGILVLVLVALAVLALSVSLRTYFGHRAVQPTFMSWLGAMLFATVPLRNFLPGSPPPGSWVDAVVVLWVIVALVASLILYAAAWWRQS